MATLVLTAAGGVLGGPLGAAIGGVLGAAADSRLLAPRRREGPRLAELKVQTSSYGTEIPRLFGTMRVAGTVFWATDLIERRGKRGGGKGGPASAEYSYSANFAVLLSARPVREVRRIWADGKLLRGAAGDWKARTGFRLHLGSEDQEADPLIASAEGAGAPAARGHAYAVFEGLELADFGNRIPSLTFEVVADDGPVRVDAIARELAAEVDADMAAEVDGFAAGGGSVRAALDALAEMGGATAAARGGRIAMRDAPGRVVEVEDLGVSADGRAARRTRATAPADTVPRAVSVRHYDPARDWQAGLQRAVRPGAGTRTLELEVAAAVGAGAAKALAERVLARAEAARVRCTVALGLEGLAVEPGDGVRIRGERGLWRVMAAETERWATVLELTPVEPAALPAAAASAGRVLSAPDLAIGRTAVELFELPSADGPLAGPKLLVAAAGGPGWRGAGLLGSLDGGASWAEWGGTAAPAVIGRVETPPAPASAMLLDLVSRPVVRIAAHMMLEEADDAALDAGVNLALLGDELVQFGRAEPLGGGLWRLGRLLRGRMGTEDAAPAAAGARFVLVEPDAVRAVDLPAHAVGLEARVLAGGAGDGDGAAEARVAAVGRSVLPLAPVRLRLETASDGSAVLRWVRRSRAGWRWLDGADASLGEERERWEVRLGFADGTERVAETDGTELALPAADRARGFAAEVRQRGDWGLGGAARLAVPGL